MLHSKLLIPTPVSLPENSKVRVLDLVLLLLVIVLLLPSTTLLIIVVGDTVSIVQLNEEWCRIHISNIVFEL